MNVALRTALGLGLAGAALSFSSSAWAQAASVPFPSTNQVAGLKSGVLTSHEIEARYQEWKSTFIQDCGDGSMTMTYPENNPPDTRSEGIGYGMVIAAYMGDKPVFDGLWNYYQRFSVNGLMNWRTFGCGNGSEAGSASDADVDAAMGLIIADVQWGGRAAEATALIQAIQTREFVDCGGRALLDPGSEPSFGSCTCVNPSYFAPGYYRAFAEYGNAAFWNDAAVDAYATLNDIQNGQTGLVPAWSSATQVQVQNCTFQVAGGGISPNEYQSDAARTPWRIATDLAWSGSPDATTFLNPMFNWVSTQNPIVHIFDRYSLAGAALNGNGNADGFRSTITMGAFATAGIVGTQDGIDQFTGAWQSLYTAGDAGHAFNVSLQLLYGLLVTGNMWDPTGPTPTLQAKPVLNPPVDGNVIRNGDFDEGLLGWRIELYGPGVSQAFAMHRAGELNVLVQGVDAPENIPLYQTVSVQTGQRYLMSFRGKAAQPRPIRLVVQQEGGTYAVYGNLADGAEVTLSDAMTTYEWVFESTGTDNAARFKFQFGDSVGDVTLDDVVFQPTTRELSVPGDLVVAPPVTPGGPTTPVTPGATPVTPGGLGTVTPGGDNTGNPTGQQTGGAIDGALPAAPDAPPGGNGVCTTDATCGAPYLCSTQLGLCYDNKTGYVYDASKSAWTKPPRGPCDLDQVFLPTIKTCYVPETGYAYNIGASQWQYYGVDFIEGQEPAADGGCAVSGVPAGRAASSWWLVGLVGAAFGLAYRRRA